MPNETRLYIGNGVKEKVIKEIEERVLSQDEELLAIIKEQ